VVQFKDTCKKVLEAAVMAAFVLLGPPAGAQSAAAQPASAPAAAPAGAAAPIPAAAFYKGEEIQASRLSPSGRWLAVSSAFGGARIGLAVFDLQEWKLLAIVARYVDADVDDVDWVGDDRLVYTITDQKRGGGDQRWWPGLFSVMRDGSEPRTLVKVDAPFLRTPTVGREPLEYNHRLLHVPDDDSGDVIVGELQWDSAREFRGYLPKRLNVRTGRATSLARGAPDRVWRYLFDSAGEPRVAVTRHLGRITLHWRDGAGAPWRVLAEYPAEKRPFDPEFVGSDGSLFVTAVRGGAEVLLRYDTAKNALADQPLVSTPGYDFWGHIVSETVGSRPLGVRVTTDAETTAWFDPQMKAFQAKADARMPGHINQVACRRCGKPDMVAIVTAYSDRDPGQLWHYLAATDRWRKVGDVRPDIDPNRMATTDLERFRARDGLEIPVWITQPPGPRQPRAAVVLVHGGPWSRGRWWNWDADAQFLASRGYLVLEPEFRGSLGYGNGLYQAGLKQWGKAMQDDLADAVAWAVGKGLVDPQRVCIAGASYGGYATLMGLIRHPDVFRCGAAWVAVTDPRLLFGWRADGNMHTEFREHSLPQRIGDPVADTDALAAVAPVEHAARITRPVFMAFGGSDRRVPLEHGTRMQRALTAAGRPPEYVVYPDEGHGWYKLETRLDFARRLEAFLATHLR
jgi:dienelactone hydrolase